MSRPHLPDCPPLLPQCRRPAGVSLTSSCTYGSGQGARRPVDGCRGADWKLEGAGAALNCCPEACRTYALAASAGGLQVCPSHRHVPTGAGKGRGDQWMGRIWPGRGAVVGAAALELKNVRKLS